MGTKFKVFANANGIGWRASRYVFRERRRHGGRFRVNISELNNPILSHSTAQPWSKGRLIFFSVGLGIAFTSSAFLAFGPEKIVGQILALPVLKLQEESIEIISNNEDVVRSIGYPPEIVSGSRKSKLIPPNEIRIRFDVRGPGGEGSVYATGSSDDGSCRYVGFRRSVGGAVTEEVSQIFGTYNDPPKSMSP